MPFAAKQESGQVKEKLKESALKDNDPSSPESKYRAADIGYFISVLTENRLSSVLLTDIFKMLFLPVPQLRDDYPAEDKDYFDTISNLLARLGPSGIRSQTVNDVENSTAVTVNLAMSMIKSLEEMARNQASAGQQGMPQDGSDGSGPIDGGKSANEQFNDKLDASNLLKKLIENGASLKDLKDDFPGAIWGMARVKRQSTGNVPKKVAADAVKNAGDKDDLEQMMSDAGRGAGELDFSQYDPLAAYLSRKTDVSKLIKLLSGLPKTSAESDQSSQFFRGEYEGYVPGKDLSALAPAAFAYPRELIYAMFAHKELPNYKKVVKEAEKTRYVIFDKSTSMDDQRLTFAKIAAISIFLSTMKNKGDFFITYFDDVVHEKIGVLKNAKRNRKAAMLSLLNSATVSGGTNIEKAILAACADLATDKRRRKKEIILITDGECSLDIEKVKRHLELAKADLITIYINTPESTQYVEQLSRVSKHVFLIENVNDHGELLKLVDYVNMR